MVIEFIYLSRVLHPLNIKGPTPTHDYSHVALIAQLGECSLHR